jgi:hypothetical protein
MAAKHDATALIRFAAAAAWLLAAVMLAQSFAKSLAVPDRIRARLADLAAVAEYEAKVATATWAEKAFRAAYPAPAVPGKAVPLPDLSVLAEQALGGTGTNRVRELRRFPVGGGTAVRILVEAEQAPLAALSPLIESAEAAAPPWRLAAVSIAPESPRPGKGRVRLEFETIRENETP